MALIVRKTLEAYKVGKVLCEAMAKQGVRVKVSSNIVPDIVLPRSKARGSTAVFVVASRRQLSINLLERQVKALKSFNNVVCVLGQSVQFQFFEFCFGHDHYTDKDGARLKYMLVADKKLINTVGRLYVQSRKKKKKQNHDVGGDASDYVRGSVPPTGAPAPAQPTTITDDDIATAAQVYLQSRLNTPVSRECAKQLLTCHGNITSIAQTGDSDLKTFVADSRRSQQRATYVLR